MATDKHEIYLRMNALVKYLEDNYNISDLYIDYQMHAKYISVVVVQEVFEYIHGERRHMYFKLFRDYDSENNKIVGPVNVVLDSNYNIELSVFKNMVLPELQTSHMEDEWDNMEAIQ